MSTAERFRKKAEQLQHQRNVEEAKPDIEAYRMLEERELALLKQKLYQHRPMDWLRERFNEDPADYQWSLLPEYAKHKWDGDPEPLYNAWMDLAAGRWAAIESGTGTGKTYAAARIAVWFLDCFPDSLVVTTAPKQKQLEVGLWKEVSTIFKKFKRLRPNAALYNLRLAVDDTDINKSDDTDDALSKSWHMIGIVSGVGSDESSAVKMQGLHREHMLIIVEEAPGVPKAVLTALKNTCSDPSKNLILAIGNPDNITDSLHEFAALPQVSSYTLSGKDHPNVVCKDPSRMPGAVTQNFIMNMLAEHGEKSTMYQSRVRGISPSQAADSLIKYEWLEKCVDNGLKYDGTYHAVGVDAANSKDGDKAALAWGRGNILHEVQEFYCDNANHLAYNLLYDSGKLAELGYADYETRKLTDYEVMNGFVGVDTVGLGWGTYNVLLDEGVEPVALHGGQWADCIPEEDYYDESEGKEKQRQSVRFQGLRSQMYWELREDLRQGKIRFDLQDKDALREIFIELISIRVAFKGNYIVVEAKEDIKKRLGNKSPNRADAIVYWNWVRKGYRMVFGGFPVMGIGT
ncbi:MAG: hypothetical protein H6550_16355 [Chitinophagales bacterium]|nr:hypothetical protein [Chitinophagales bacterium]